MKIDKQCKRLVVALLLGAVSQVSAVVIDFTAAEGYADGDLNNNANWTESSGGTWTVDATAGTVSASNPAFAWANNLYTGTGSTLTENDYTSTSIFSLDMTGALLTTTDGNDSIYSRNSFTGGGDESHAAIRQDGVSSGVFDLWIWNNISGAGVQGISADITAAELGLAHNGSAWTDTLSDELRLTHSMVYSSGAGTWVESATLYNVTTDSLLASLTSSPITEDDNSFRDNNNEFRFDVARMDRNPNMTYRIDSIEIVPEPASFGLFGVAFIGLVYVRRLFEI